MPLQLPDPSGLTPKESALLYAEKGWPVFPCEAAHRDDKKDSWSKKPHPMLRQEEAERGEGGWKLATTDPDTIARWWDADPNALIGLVPGMNGAVVLDADGPEGIKRLFDIAKDFDLTSTPTSRTPGKGGGLHVWFDRRHIKGTIGNGSLKKVPGEARGDRGYVIVPPSTMPNDKSYTFTGHTFDLMALPEWAQEILPWEKSGSTPSISDVTRGDEQEWLIKNGHSHSSEEAQEQIKEMLGAIRVTDRGGRHPTATKAAATLLSKAQSGLQVNLLEGLSAIREALVEVKPERGGVEDFDRFVSDAIARRVAEDRAKAASTVDTTRLRQAEEREVWEDPEDLSIRQRGTTRPFPTHDLPDVMRRAVEEVAKATQMSDTFPAMAALAAASAATAGGYVLSMSHSWEEALCLYMIGVANPSERKTAALKPFVDSIYHATDQWSEMVSAARQKWEADGKVLERKLKDAEKTGDALTLAGVYAEVEDHEREGQNFVVPHSIVHSDPTQEALAMSMQDQHGVAFVASSEGAFIANLAGRYSGGDRHDMSVVNQGYNRERVLQSRATRGKVVVDMPHVVIVSFVQPRVAEMLNHPDFEGSGFLSRVLYAHPPSLVGQRATRLSRYSPLYGVAMDAWKGRIAAIFTRGWGREREPHTLTMDAEASQVYEKWWAFCETRSAADPWWGKAHGQTARIAAILELVESPGATHVTRQSVETAISVMEFFADERQVMRSSLLEGGDRFQMTSDMSRAVKHIARRWDRIIEEKDGVIRVRDLARWLHTKSDDAFRIAEQLVEAGWLREEDTRRSDSIAYSPHPSIPAVVLAGDGEVLAKVSPSVTFSDSSVTALKESVTASVTPKNPVSTGDSGQVSRVSRSSKSETASKGALFSSSSSFYTNETDGDDSSQLPSQQAPDAPAPGVTLGHLAETPGSERRNGEMGTVTLEEETVTLEGASLADQLDKGVEEVLAAPDVARSLDSMVPGGAAKNETPGHTSVRSDTHCPICNKFMGTTGAGKRRCAEHGEVEDE